MAVSLLLALAAFPLAFIVTVLVKYRRSVLRFFSSVMLLAQQDKAITSDAYIEAIRTYTKLELQPAYEAAIRQELSVYRMPEFALTDAVWHHSIQKLEDKTAIPGLSYGLRDNLFDTCLWYVFCTQQLRKPKPTPEPNTPVWEAWAEWQERDRNAIEKFRALSVYHEHVPIERVFKLANR